jgi:hypothetical protein
MEKETLFEQQHNVKLKQTKCITWLDAYVLKIITKYLVQRLKRQKNYSMIDCFEKVVNHS